MLTATHVNAVRDGDSLFVSAIVALPGADDIDARRRLSLSFIIAGPSDTLSLPAVHVLGRQFFYRHARGALLQGVDSLEQVVRGKALLREGPCRYRAAVPFQSWMDHAQVRLVISSDGGCAPDGVTIMTDSVVGGPQMVVRTREIKGDTVSGALSGRAYITFPLDTVNIKPDYLKNRQYLASIKASIDSVKLFPNAEIRRMTIKGYASPEGSYDHNAYLARERTESLKRYITQHFNVPADRIVTDYVPEDWDGLREFLHRSQARRELPHWQQVTAIVESDAEPDEKERLIRSRYPADFRVLLKYYLPWLRHSDYTIAYDWFKETKGRICRDTLWQMPVAQRPDSAAVWPRARRFRPWLAVKTNLLFDMALTPNVELEMQLGPNSRWSLMFEDWFPWFLSSDGSLGDIWRGTSDISGSRYSYELWVLGGELRYWFRPRCNDLRPWLTGTFVGAYGAWGKYDWEWDSNGDQGEFTSAGLTIGRSWPLSRHWNLELSGSIGAVWGPRRHYHGEFNDTHLIWKYTDNLFYVGPTKLKLSLVWLVPSLRRHRSGKGGGQ